MFWSIFFLGSMLLLGFDVIERRTSSQLVPGAPTAADAAGMPTP
jgi:hypothetical protein